MKQTAISPVTFGRRILKRLSPLLTAICVASCVQTTTPAHAVETGIRGTVLWGPIKPGPSKLGQSDEAPLKASFTVYGAEETVAQFESDSNGRFEVSLSPGEYTIVPDKRTPIPYAEKQKTQVTVPEDGFVVITIRLDTGMK